MGPANYTDIEPVKKHSDSDVQRGIEPIYHRKKKLERQLA
jgi:hypothetical protein